MTIENTLDEHPSKTYFDLIVAADVFVYFGTLQRILQVFSDLSNGERSSWLVFSCERATPDEAPLGFRLLGSGRFAHTKDHVVEMARSAGYTLYDYQEMIPRIEKGVPVQGHLLVFEKRHGGGDNKVVDDDDNKDANTEL
jgi:predicted TPR repeat methyltransferase